MKRLLKKLVPAFILGTYHRTLSWVSAVSFGFPSENMIVIGVTGTNGKSTVCNMVARILERAGHKVGMTTTANFKIGKKEWLNDTKMTMLGRGALQKLLAEMSKAGCTHAVVETSSEGIRQYRHADINYDVVVFTNLTPEHIESHGSFENYKAAKGKLFAKLTRGRYKVVGGKRVPKTSIVNLGDEHAEYFLSFPADSKRGFLVPCDAGKVVHQKGVWEIRASRVEFRPEGSRFTVGDTDFELTMPGGFNIENALAAIAACNALDVDYKTAAEALWDMAVPGRLERIEEGQPFTVMVDYAPEPESLKKLYEVVGTMKKERVIHVLGSCGGGRDVSRRPVLGRMAGEKAQIVIVTNEDPYDDDPMEIIEDVAAGARESGKRDEEDLFLESDRGKAIERAIALAEDGDLVLITGKGCEQAIATAGGEKISWDDREVARDVLRRRMGK
ncbi:MAG: UDP-N-acetylmuramyl-tripeptide synthetase [Patescibacteria group bacterium]|nr:UDP-N-acetylmuramyl-tripeptide synthetase [Patescibacteria group bacterium]